MPTMRKLPPAAVDGGGHAVARQEIVREREPFAREHFVRRFRAPAAAQERLVEDGLLALRESR